jgi:UDP:flavonoid glycosyltransferase YjiC (YdhE family)
VRVLLSTTSGAGHFRPLLPVVRALQDAGHHVAVAAPEEAAAMVTREGVEHLPFGGVPADDPERGAVFAQIPQLAPEQARRLVGSELFGRINTTWALPGAQAAVAAFGPDLVVHESGESAVALAAEAAGVPVVGVSPTLSIDEFTRAIAAGTEGLRKQLGLEPDPDGARRLAAPVISWWPASVDLPDTAATDVRRYRDPDGPAPGRSSDRDLVYVTLGSEAHALPFFAPVLRACATGALAAGRGVLVTTGAEQATSALAGLEGDLRVQAWVDQHEVLQRAQVVVCHAGSGTTMAALAAGVPIVAVPLFADQPFVAERVAAVGAGVSLEPGPELSDEVEAAVRRLADTPPLGSARTAREIATLPPIEEALPWLESLAR